ncbi:MAG: hypothetical protein HY996_05075 [Micrococcales bacterium]|nr:hypothetical protein [Micrococcales bacterium]
MVVMKRGLAFALVGVGVLLVALGLLFLVGAAGQTSRLVVAGAGLVVGAACAAIGVAMHRRADAESPETLRAAILDLARQKNGEVSRADVAAALGARMPKAEPVLDELVRNGVCKATDRDGHPYLVFESMQPRLVIKKCRFCTYEAPLGDDRATCPNCGGALDTVRTARSVSGGDAYGMD